VWPRQQRAAAAPGVGVETLNLEVATLDEVSETIARSAGFVVGSPTLGGHMPTQVCARPPWWLYACGCGPLFLKEQNVRTAGCVEVVCWQ